MAGSRRKARQAALQALYQWQLTQQPPAQVERDFIASDAARGADIEYFQELLANVTAHTAELDHHLQPHLDRAIADIDPVERAILRIGAYELQARLEIPYRVILNEGVELAKTFGADQSHKFVNAVLDKTAAQLRAAEPRGPQA